MSNVIGENLVHVLSEAKQTITVVDALKRIVANGQYEKVKFENGKVEMVDLFTASAVSSALKNMKIEKNRIKTEEFINKSPAAFMKIVRVVLK